MEKIYNTAHTRICTYDDALKLLESLSLETELSVLAMNHNEAGKVSITYSFNKDIKEQLSNEVVVAYFIKAKSDILSYMMEEKKRNLVEAEKVQEYVNEPVLPKVTSFFEDLLTKFEDVVQEDNPEVLKEISTKLQAAAEDVSKIDLFDTDRPAALMKQLLKSYKNALNIPVNEIMTRRDKKGNIVLNDKKPEETLAESVQKEIPERPLSDNERNAKMMRDLRNAIEEANNGTYNKKITDEVNAKVKAYNEIIDSIIPLQKEINDLVQKLPNKDNYDVFINEQGKFEVVKVPGVMVLKNVKFGFNRRNSEHDILYADMYANGVFSSEEAEVAIGYSNSRIMYSTSKVPFERFTIIRSGSNYLAVEEVEDIVDEITRLAGVKK